MKPIKFWAKEVQQLSALERVCLIDAFKSLSSWEVFKHEYSDLDLIKRILEMENRFNQIKTSGDNAYKTIW